MNGINYAINEEKKIIYSSISVMFRFELNAKTKVRAINTLVIYREETNKLLQNASSKSRYRTFLRRERKWWKRFNPTRIDQQNKYLRIKETLRHYKGSGARVSKNVQ